jgi:hypothetical protein
MTFSIWRESVLVRPPNLRHVPVADRRRSRESHPASRFPPGPASGWNGSTTPSQRNFTFTQHVHLQLARCAAGLRTCAGGELKQESEVTWARGSFDAAVFVELAKKHSFFGGVKNKGGPLIVGPLLFI